MERALEFGVEGKTSVRGARQKLWSILAYVWIAVVGWVVLGGALAQVLIEIRAVGPYCVSPVGSLDSFAACTPCSFTSGVFGVVELTPCPNTVLAGLARVGVETPQFIIVVLAMLARPLVEPLRESSVVLPALVLMGPLIAALARTAYFNFVRRPDLARGLNRVLLLCLGLLAVNLAMILAGAWPWLRTG